MIRTVMLALALLTVNQIVKAQETNKQTQTIYPGVVAKYNVLASDDKTIQGLYQAIYHKKHVIATGLYKNGKRAGVWHFYDPQGNVIEHFNYDENLLIYEANPGPANWIQYDISTDTKAKLTRPIRVGGTFYGYIPYLKQFKLVQQYNPLYFYGVMQIIVSPAGRLAECKLVIKARNGDNIVDSYVINNETLTDNEKQFIPATENGQNVASTIYIACRIMPDDTVSLYQTEQ